MKKIRLLVLCGGQSAEHEISLVSAWNLLSTLPLSKFSVQLICIDKKGNWLLQSVTDFLQQQPHPTTISIPGTTQPLLVQPGNSNQSVFNLQANEFLPEFDVIFPLLHGPNGEDGSIQGLLRHIQKPFIGSSVLGSAICMDKVIAKQLFLQNKIPTSAFEVVHKNEKFDSNTIATRLGYPLFVKPANLGSSVGIRKAENEKELNEAIKNAFTYDKKVIVEEFVDGQEVECAVLGNEDLLVSEPGTYIHGDEFFDYDTKYLKNDEISMQIPAKILSEKQRSEVKELSKKAYNVLQCSGFARVDTFITKDGRFLVNEINTIPGFTQNSMYPVLMERSGIPYSDLVERMCELAIQQFKE